MQKIYKEDLVELINEIQHPIWIYDRETYQILRVNKYTVKLLGYTDTELREMTTLDLRSPEEIKYFKENNHWKIYTYRVSKFYKLRKKSGEDAFVEIQQRDITYKKRPAVITTVYDLTERIKYELELHKSEERFRISQEISLDAFTIMNPVYDEGEIIDFTWEYANQAACKIMKFPAEEIIGKRLLEKLPGNNDELFILYKKVAVTGIPHDIEIKYKSDDIDGWFRNMCVKLGEGIAISFHDITQRKQQQEEIENKNREMQDVFERISDAFIALSNEGIIKYVNSTALRILNVENSVIGKNFWDCFPIYKKPLENIIRQAAIDLKPISMEFEGIMTPRWYRVNLFPSAEGLTIYAVDITLSKAYEEQLLSTLREKEMLLKEVHHRIKNNLQIIISILNLQSYYINDPDALEIFKQSQNRIRSMALIHEKLYKTEKISSVNLENYITDIAKYLFHTYSVNNELIQLNLDMDDIELDSNAAISFGLIINELFTNSLKYAFNGGRKGVITISAKLKGSELVFQIYDNGKGFPEDINFRNTNSLGLQLVNTLVEQLGGRISLSTNEGTNFTIVVSFTGKNIVTGAKTKEQPVRHVIH